MRLPNWLGDGLLARPLLHALRTAQPAAGLRLVGPAPLLELLAYDGLADALEPWPADRAARRALVARARAWQPTHALALPPSFSSAWFLHRTGAAVRIGYAHEGRSPLLTHAARRPARGELHLSREYLALGARLGATEGAVPPLEPDAGARSLAAARLRAHGVAGPYAVLGPGAAYGPAKRWGAERFGALGRRLADAGLSVLVCGTRAERPECEAAARAAGQRAFVLAGETSLVEQAALCAAAVVTVCNDSGLAHLAAATGAATLAVFGSTSSAWTAPLGPRVRVVQRPPVCAPCFRRTCRIGYLCLAAVEVEMVHEACMALAA